MSTEGPPADLMENSSTPLEPALLWAMEKTGARLITASTLDDGPLERVGSA